jgi:hypothetical protein
MLLLVLGPVLILIGFIILGRQNGLLADYKKMDGILVAYERDPLSSELYPIISFTYMRKKYFFKNSKRLKFLRDVLGSQHTVFMKVIQPKEEGKPIVVKAVLMDLSAKTIEAVFWISSGALSLLIFSQATGFYFFYVVFIFTLISFYSYAGKNLFFAEFFKNHISGRDESHVFTTAFSEEEFKKIKILDLSAVRIFRELWLKSQMSKGFVFIAITAFCFLLTDFSLNAEPEAKVKVETVQKGPSISEVIDAGSLEAAHEKHNVNKPFPVCIWFESTSCYFTYKPLEPEEAAKLNLRVVNFLIQDLGSIFLLLGLVGLFSRQIFNQHDQLDIVKKPEGEN